ncbi:MAG: cupredoxin domain-containing protein [Chloroflexi bacterium]|nr:cupredoxin domain-containing protein [Chloroflexota bacterium]
MKSMRSVVGLLSLAGLLALAACGSGGGEAKNPPPQAQGMAQEVKVDMGDYFYEPSQLTIKAGQVHFVLTNVGKTAHRFAITGNGVKVSSRNVGAGREGTLDVELAPGTYKMGCTLGDHEARGSVGQIVVQ